MDDILESSVEALVDAYIEKRVIEDLTIFGIKTTSIFDLENIGFDRIGNDEFSLLEKCFRINGKEYLINLKLYFSGNNYYSNGIDIYGKRILSVFRKIFLKNEKSDGIKKIILLYEPNGDYGSLIINDILDVRFGKAGRGSQKKRYHILGISTDFECTEGWQERAMSTHGAKIMKPKISFATAKKRYRKNRALQELISYFTKNNPSACKAGEVY